MILNPSFSKRFVKARSAYLLDLYQEYLEKCHHICEFPKDYLERQAHRSAEHSIYPSILHEALEHLELPEVIEGEILGFIGRRWFRCQPILTMPDVIQILRHTEEEVKKFTNLRMKLHIEFIASKAFDENCYLSSHSTFSTFGQTCIPLRLEFPSNRRE